MAAILTLETVGLRHGTGAEILSNIGLSLGRGDFVTVSGGAAAGKSALAAIAGLERLPSRGVARLFGRDARTLTGAERGAWRQRIGFVGESLPLVGRLSVAGNVGLPLRVRGIDRAERDERVGELLEWLGLGARAEALPDALSQGERMRVAIARAVIGRPELIVGDEPMQGVGAPDERRVIQLFERLIDLGSAVLILSRDAGLAERLPATRHLRLAQGRLLSDGRVSALRA